MKFLTGKALKKRSSASFPNIHPSGVSGEDLEFGFDHYIKTGKFAFPWEI